MRIETGRDTDHRTSPPNFPGRSEAKAWVRTARRQPCKVAIWHTGRGKGCRKTTSRFRRWIDPSCAARNTATWASQTTKVDGIGTNRPALHDAPALGASSQLGAAPLLPTPSLSSSPKPSATQASSPASLSTKGFAPAKKHPQPPRNCTVEGTFQPENSRNKGNTYYKPNRQATHSYTTYGNTRRAEKGKIAKTL